MAYTALYSASAIADVIIDAIVSLAGGMVTGGSLYLAGGAIALGIGIGIYLGLFNKFLGFIGSFTKKTKRM